MSDIAKRVASRRPVRATALIALIIAATLAQAATDRANPNALLDMSLDDLLAVQVRVPAALTRLTLLESPAATTVITAEDIRLTPARNLYDLIDVYVPGAYWMTSDAGPHLGVRGNISSRNYKYLLLVNGLAMNNKAFAGAASEMEMWDLSDVERIEIVSGPGSVTYGPGAVAGVISITTRKPDAGEGTHASLGYVGPYQSKALGLSHHQEGESYKLFAHASIVRSEGQPARTFQVASNNTLGFVGQDFQPAGKALDYFGDYQDQPQLKLHLAVDLANDWHWWMRYTQQGSNWFSNELKSPFGGQLVDQQGLRSRQVTTAVQHGINLGEKLRLATLLSLGSYDFERRRENVFSPDPRNALNYQVNFAEDQVTARATLNWEMADWAQIAFGAEWNQDRFKPGWGDSPQEMRLGESGEIINGPDSQALLAGNGGSANRLAPGSPAIYVGNGWSTSTLSIFSEANLAIGAGHKLLLSGRGDRNTYTDWMWSPRLAWISTLAEGHVIKAIAQRSLRMNTASQLFVNAQRGIANQPERLEGLELRYSAQPSKALAFNLSAFHNDEEVIAFQGTDNTNRLIGNLKLYGLEGDVHYSWERGRIGASFSHVKQQNWKLEPGVLSSGVSYSDYRLLIGGNSGGIQNGIGNELNNWPSQSLKLFGNYKFNESLTLHADARWYSELKGAKSGLAGLRQAVAGTAAATPAFYAALDRIAAEGVYGKDLRFNASLEYRLSPADTLHLYGQNLFGGNGNKRYAYDDAGNTNAAPRRVRFVEESPTYGVRLTHRF